MSQGVGSTTSIGLALRWRPRSQGPTRNATTAVFATMTAIGSVMGLVVGERPRCHGGGVPGEHIADRAGDDLPGPHRPYGKPTRTDEARYQGWHTRRFSPSRSVLKGLDVSITIGSAWWPCRPLSRLIIVGTAENPAVPSSTCSATQPVGHVPARSLLAGGVVISPDRLHRLVRAGHLGLARYARA